MKQTCFIYASTNISETFSYTVLNIQKIEELQLIVNEKGQNLRRLQAQRNELNAKGIYFMLK